MKETTRIYPDDIQTQGGPCVDDIPQAMNIPARPRCRECGASMEYGDKTCPFGHKQGDKP